MVLSRPTFFGSSMLSCRSTVGWNGASSQFEATLVDDPSNGDSFTVTNNDIGKRAVFTLGAFSFAGILSKATVDRDRNGFPTYNVLLKDPRHLLEASKIITSNYNRTTTGILNLFNVYGYYENIAYGSSQSNDTGMPWSLIRDGISVLCNNPYSSFGGPISYRGQTYGIDLSQLPSLPVYFRVGGGSHGLSILDFIQIVCDAASYDFFITLVGSTITVKTVARVNAYPFGKISEMINTTFAGSVLRSSVGFEEREEVTSTFLIGGDVHSLVKVNPENTYRFWGFDASGSIIVGDTGAGYANFYATSANGSPNHQFYSYPVRKYNLYIPEIGGITGSTTYATNDLELQVLLGIGQHRDTFVSWERYLEVSNPTLFNTIGLGKRSFYIQPNQALGVVPNNTVRTDVNTIQVIQNASRNSLFDTGTFRLRLVYDALLKFARDYYGKKYALKLTGISRTVDTDTGVYINSHDISDGGWVDETDTNDLLNLPSEVYDIFQTSDGRFTSYTRYNAINADLSRVNPSNSFYHSFSSQLFSKTRLDNQIYFSGANTYVVADVDPLYDYPDSIFGTSGTVGALAIATGINIEASAGTITALGSEILRRLQVNQRQSSFPLVAHPLPRTPSGFEVPIKSNILTYGPWYAQGQSGRIIYEQDTSLVPWNYGSYTNLNLAGNAKAAQGISHINVIEAGYIDTVGYPLYNIGDIILANGPNITNISINFSKEGAATTYRFETYVPRYGQIGKYNVDLMQKQAIANIRRSAEAKNLARLNALNVLSANEANTTLSLLPQLYDALNIRSPNNILVAGIVQSSGNNVIYPTVSITTFKESLGLVPPNGTDYENSAIATIDSVICPYQINGTANLLPKLLTPGGFGPDIVMNSTTLSPYRTSPSGWTNRIYTKGSSTYEEINDDFTVGIDQTATTKKVFGLKSPLVLTGWGYDLLGNRTPSDTDFLTNYSTFKSGPIDPLWDNNRGVWTVHDILNARNDNGAISAGGSGLFNIYTNNTNTGQKLYAYNWNPDNVIASGTKIQLGYVANENRWYALVGLPGSGSSESSVIGGSGITVSDGTNSDNANIVRFIYTNLQIPNPGFFGGADPQFIVSNIDDNTAGVTLNFPTAGMNANGILTSGLQDIGGIKSFTNGYISLNTQTYIPWFTPSGLIFGYDPYIARISNAGVVTYIASEDNDGILSYRTGSNLYDQRTNTEAAENPASQGCTSNFEILGHHFLEEGSGISVTTLNSNRPRYIVNYTVQTKTSPFSGYSVINAGGQGHYTFDWVASADGRITGGVESPLYSVKTRGGIVIGGETTLPSGALLYTQGSETWDPSGSTPGTLLHAIQRLALGLNSLGVYP